MIEGVVNSAYEAVISLSLHDSAGRTREIEAAIDTGYNGFLTLPHALVAELGLAHRGRGRATLADGSEALLDVYEVAVIWDGDLRNVRAAAADFIPLVGMRMLDQHSLYVDVRDGGRVVIQTSEPN